MFTPLLVALSLLATIVVIVVSLYFATRTINQTQTLKPLLQTPQQAATYAWVRSFGKKGVMYVDSSGTVYIPPR